jgi:hypothetical protein
MSVSSINDHIKAPKGAVFIGAEVRGAWFVIRYSVPIFKPDQESPCRYHLVEFFFNQDGREVFRLEIHPAKKKQGWFRRLLEKVKHANTNSAQDLRQSAMSAQ